MGDNLRHPRISGVSVTFIGYIKGVRVYHYDKVDNRLTAREKTTTPPLAKEQEGFEKREYNKSGSPIKAKGFTYEYNANQRPIKVFKPSETGSKELIAEYRYNSFGERIKKVTYAGNQKTVTYFLYDGHTLAAEISSKETKGQKSGGVYFLKLFFVTFLN